jgi:hypothetical protein
MKTLLKLLKGRVTRWGFLAGLLIAVGATVGWNNPKEQCRQYKFGGGWIGGAGDGSIWNALQIPKDPAGLTCGVRVNTTMYGESVAGLLAGFGADTLTEAVGEMEMISRDTAKYGFVSYMQKQGNPPTLCAIVVMTGKLKFTGPDNFFVDYTLNVYLPAADADLDGYPDPGAAPALTIPDVHETAKRVPIP